MLGDVLLLTGGRAAAVKHPYTSAQEPIVNDESIKTGAPIDSHSEAPIRTGQATTAPIGANTPKPQLSSASSASSIRIGHDINIFDALGHVMMWVVISIVTLGFGFMLFPYSFAKHVLNRTYLEQGGQRIGKFKCEIDLGSQLGHAFIWFLLSIVTLGLAYVVYFYEVWGFALSKTEVV